MDRPITLQVGLLLTTRRVASNLPMPGMFKSMSTISMSVSRATSRAFPAICFCGDLEPVDAIELSSDTSPHQTLVVND